MLCLPADFSTDMHGITLSVLISATFPSAVGWAQLHIDTSVFSDSFRAMTSSLFQALQVEKQWQIGRAFLISDCFPIEGSGQMDWLFLRLEAFS